MRSTEKVNIRLTSFEGPLDLLYHLIEKNEIDIYDIPIAELTDQYMEFLESHSMDSMSEFILMAATLLEIKSKMLLPAPKKENPEEDPRQELVDKLVEYKRFKQAAEEFGARGEFAVQYVYREPEAQLLDMLKAESRVRPAGELLDGISLDGLYDVFESVLARRELKVDRIRGGFDSVRRDSFTVDEKISQIRELLSKNGRISFYSVFSGGITRLEKVVAFLAVLELIKREEISIRQDRPFDDIFISAHKGASA